jgi:ABC-type multidrug transport system fused ATPase/permease subunit
MVNTTAQHAGPIFVNLANTALLRTSPSGSRGASIAARSHPLPYTPFQTTNVLAAQGFAITQVLLLSLAFVTPAFIQFVVREREVKAKHQQLISGVSIPAYWAANAAFDLASYLLPFILALVTLNAFGASALLTTARDVLPALLALLAAYGLAGAAFSYALSHAFSAPGTAAAAAVMLNILQFAGVLALTVLGAVKTTCTPVPAIKAGLSVLPFFALGSGLAAITQLDTVDITAYECARSNGRAFTPQPPLTSAFALRAGGGPLLYLLCTAAAYFTAAVAVDYARSDMRLRRRLEGACGARAGGGAPPAPAAPPAQPPDADVHAEEVRVEFAVGAGVGGRPAPARGASVNRAASLLEARPVADEEVGLLAAAGGDGGGGGGARDAILLSHLHKEFPRKVAVRNLSFGVPPGEVFGFLGINGAGKTTTLNMLTGDELCTSGTALLAGYDIVEEQAAVRRLLGYCPQFDALLDKLTAREHLELYARIKGVGGGELVGGRPPAYAKLRNAPTVDPVTPHTTPTGPGGARQARGV